MLKSVTFWLVTNVQSDLRHVKACIMTQCKVNLPCPPWLYFTSIFWKDHPLPSHSDRTREASRIPALLPLCPSSPKARSLYLLTISCVHLYSQGLIAACLDFYTYSPPPPALPSFHSPKCCHSPFPQLQGSPCESCLNMSMVPIALRRKPERGFPLMVPCHPLRYSFPSCVGPASTPSAHLECLSPAWLISFILMFQDLTRAPESSEEPRPPTPLCGLGWGFPYACLHYATKRTGLWWAT